MQGFGNWLFEQRKRAGLTQGQLATKAGISTSYISTLERGQRHPITNAPSQPAVDVVENIAKALGVPVDEARLAAGYAPLSRHSVNGFIVELPDDVEMVIPHSTNINSQEDADEFKEAFMIAYETVKARLARQKNG